MFLAKYLWHFCLKLCKLHKTDDWFAHYEIRRFIYTLPWHTILWEKLARKKRYEHWNLSHCPTQTQAFVLKKTPLVLFNLLFKPIRLVKSSNKLWKEGKNRDAERKCMSGINSLLWQHIPQVMAMHPAVLITQIQKKESSIYFWGYSLGKKEKCWQEIQIQPLSLSILQRKLHIGQKNLLMFQNNFTRTLRSDQRRQIKGGGSNRLTTGSSKLSNTQCKSLWKEQNCT